MLQIMKMWRWIDCRCYVLRHASIFQRRKLTVCPSSIQNQRASSLCILHPFKATKLPILQFFSFTCTSLSVVMAVWISVQSVPKASRNDNIFLCLLRSVSGLLKMHSAHMYSGPRFLLVYCPKHSCSKCKIIAYGPMF